MPTLFICYFFSTDVWHQKWQSCDSRRCQNVNNYFLLKIYIFIEKIISKFIFTWKDDFFFRITKAQFQLQGWPLREDEIEHKVKSCFNQVIILDMINKSCLKIQIHYFWILKIFFLVWSKQRWKNYWRWIYQSWFVYSRIIWIWRIWWLIIFFFGFHKFLFWKK